MRGNDFVRITRHHVTQDASGTPQSRTEMVWEGRVHLTRESPLAPWTSDVRQVDTTRASVLMPRGLPIDDLAGLQIVVLTTGEQGSIAQVLPQTRHLIVHLTRH